MVNTVYFLLLTKRHKEEVLYAHTMYRYIRVRTHLVCNVPTHSSTASFLMVLDNKRMCVCERERHCWLAYTRMSYHILATFVYTYVLLAMQRIHGPPAVIFWVWLCSRRAIWRCPSRARAVQHCCGTPPTPLNWGVPEQCRSSAAWQCCTALARLGHRQIACRAAIAMCYKNLPMVIVLFSINTLDK